MKRIFVCEECGNEDIEIKAWVNANTFEFKSHMDNDGKCWCPQCDKTLYMCDKEIFNKKQNES